jgi:hypothetical protein
MRVRSGSGSNPAGGRRPDPRNGVQPPSPAWQPGTRVAHQPGGKRRAWCVFGGERSGRIRARIDLAPEHRGHQVGSPRETAVERAKPDTCLCRDLPDRRIDPGAGKHDRGGVQDRLLAPCAHRHGSAQRVSRHRLQAATQPRPLSGTRPTSRLPRPFLAKRNIVRISGNRINDPFIIGRLAILCPARVWMSVHIMMTCPPSSPSCPSPCRH